MSLTSPRFRSSNTLIQVEANQNRLQKDSTGRAVHLVQMALLDLGYTLPNSTSNPNYSPDGNYGEETKQAVKKFQRDNPPLVDDGIIGQQTIRVLDRRFNNFQYSVGLHFRAIALTNVPFQQSLTNAETVFAQYGIRVYFASGESIRLTPDQQTMFNRIDQECNWTLNDGEFNQLQGLGSRAPSTAILVYHVNSFADSNVLGCGGHANNRPACTITASALAWDTAHEVCHVLLTSSFSPTHINDLRNLMHPASRRSISIPVLTDRQVAQIRRSVCCRRI
ncbi:MAG: peptidoglycan-binding domain-containing protein [Methylococcales bacterium]